MTVIRTSKGDTFIRYQTSSPCFPTNYTKGHAQTAQLLLLEAAAINRRRFEDKMPAFEGHLERQMKHTFVERQCRRDAV